MSFTNAETFRQQANQAPPAPIVDVDAAPPAAAIAAPIATPPALRPDARAIFDAAALHLAECERASEHAEAAVQEAQAKLNQVAARIVSLEGERAQIIARRTGGDLRDGDGAGLAVLAADLEGLNKLRTDAAAALTLVQAPAQSAQRAVGLARERLARVEDQQALAQLKQQADTLADLLLRTVIRLLAAEQRLGLSGRDGWAPPRQLTDMLRKAAFTNRGDW
jgi:hypothetical protein